MLLAVPDHMLAAICCKSQVASLRLSRIVMRRQVWVQHDIRRDIGGVEATAQVCGEWLLAVLQGVPGDHSDAEPARAPCVSAGGVLRGSHGLGSC